MFTKSLVSLIYDRISLTKGWRWWSTECEISDMWQLIELMTSLPGLLLLGDCFNQLLPIMLGIYHFMDEGYEIQSVFFDIPKTFDKVWLKGFVFILKQNSKSGKWPNILEDLQTNKKQIVVLNEPTSNWENIHAGVSHGSWDLCFISMI